MIIKTKKTQLEKNTYVKMAMIDVVKDQWYWAGIPVLIAAMTIFYPETVWFIVIAVVAVLLYGLFWFVQFTGVTQLEQNKVMFEKLTYEIDSRQIMMKLNEKQGMQIKWEQIKDARRTKDAFVLVISRGQYIHLPLKAFNSDNDMRFMESLLKRKDLIAEAK